MTRDAIQSNSFQIIVGDHDSKSNHMEGETNHSIKQVNIHPKWNPDRRAYDYAILELNDKINSTNNHKAICLPNKGNTYSAHWIWRLASVTGVEVAIDSAVAIYVMQEHQVPLGLRLL